MRRRALAALLAGVLACGSAARADEKGSRPFAEGGALEVPAGNPIRMGEPSSGLTIIADGGSTIRKQGKALALERGKMGVGLRGGGSRAIQVVAGKLTLQCAGGRFTVERDGARVVVRVIDGGVAVAGAGAGAPRNLTAGQALTVPARGAPAVGELPRADRGRDAAWIGELPPGAAPSPSPAPKKPASKRRRSR